MKAFESQGFEKPTDIQSGSFSALLTGKDFFGIAQTGGGKTVAFAVPVLERLSQIAGAPNSGCPRAVVLAPTRELAQQIGECFNTFGKAMNIRHTVIFGGAPFGPQISALRRGVDVIIATPGRLMDHVRRGNISFEDTSMFILDEADRMLDMGFLPDVKEISAMLGPKHQTMLFSATASKQIRELVKGLLTDYDTVEIAGTTALPEKIKHKLLFLKVRDKDAALLDILEDDSMEQAVVFTRTKHHADKLTQILSNAGLKVDAIHGDKKQNARTRILSHFRVGKLKVLVATDVAARGIDVEAVSHVVNYNMPMEAENYVHRVGRTGRAGRDGTGYSFVDGGDLGLLADVERFIKMAIDIDDESPYACDRNQLENLPNPKVRGGGRGGQGGGRGGQGGGRGGFGGNRGGQGGGRGGFGGNRGGGGRDGGRSSYGGDRRDDRRDNKPNYNNDPRRSADFEPRPERRDDRGGNGGGFNRGGDRRDDRGGNGGNGGGFNRSSERRDDRGGNGGNGGGFNRSSERRDDRGGNGGNGGGFNRSSERRDDRGGNGGNGGGFNRSSERRDDRGGKPNFSSSKPRADRSRDTENGDKTFKKRVFGAGSGANKVRKRTAN